MMNELIRKQAMLHAIEKCHKKCCRTDSNGDEWIHYETTLNELEALPPVQPEHDYKKAFSVACELLIGANLFGITVETMFKEIMEKDGIVSSLGYEKYILENLARLKGEDDDTD